MWNNQDLKWCLEMTQHASLKDMVLLYVMFDKKRGTIFNSNKEIVMIAPRVRDVYVLDMTSFAQEYYFFSKATENLNWLWSINYEKYTLVIVDEYSRNNILVNFCDEKEISQNFSSPYTPEQNGSAERKNRNLIESARTMLSGSVFSKQYWTEVVATACYTQNRIFNTRRQQTEETYHIAFDESIDVIKFTKPSDENITIVESERYPTDEPELVVIETDVSSDQHDQADQNDQNDQNGHSAQDDEILNDGQSEHSNHIIDNLPNTKDV
ncbi:retrovirus-related pol polyprotein from transposon TNT 1-94 [Tanacetum coccineum]